MTVTTHFSAIGVDCAIVATRDEALDAATALAQVRLAQLDAAASRFRPDSEVSQLAARRSPTAAATVTAPVSPLLLSLLADAQWAAEVTDGLVDPTLGRAMEAAGYDADLTEVLDRTRSGTRTGARPEPPPAAEVATRPVSTLRDLRIDRTTGTVTIAAGTLLDLGATAKAAMADRLARELAERWPGGFLVSLGGDIAVAGRPPGGGWVISATDPTSTDGTDGTDGTDHRIAVTTQGVATSGTDRRRWPVAGELRHHLLDPRTGAPAGTIWRRVTCVGASALEANTASTAACVLGHAAIGWLTDRGIPARLVPERGGIGYTPGWPQPSVARAS